VVMLHRCVSPLTAYAAEVPIRVKQTLVPDGTNPA